MVVRVPIRISDKRDIEVDGKAYADAPADSVQTAGGVYTLVLDVDDPEDMLGSALEDWEAVHGGRDNAPVEELERWEAEQGFDKADDL